MGIPGLLVGLPIVKSIFDIGKHIYDGIQSSKGAKYSQQLIDQAYKKRLNELNLKEKELLKQKEVFDNRIKDMEGQIQNQKNLYEKMKLENEKILLEQK